MLLFTEKYSMMDELGRGAFSVVKQCREIATNKCFAAKIFDMTKMTTRELQKLEREASICRRLKHENIVEFIETLTQGCHHFMIFELITGGELFDDIVARECYTEQDASSIMQQILSGIKYCHENNIIHRDLKPENLLLLSKSKNAAIKIADFGLAVTCEPNCTFWFGFAGTPGYLAPEVVRKQPYGRLVDVWGCGIILYILLGGYCPFWDDNNHKLYQQIKTYPVNFDGTEWAGVSNEAKKLILMMLEKDPTKRIDARTALENDWIKNRQSVAGSSNRQNTVSTIRKFNARRKLKGAILSTLVSNRLKSKFLGDNIGKIETAANENQKVVEEVPVKEHNKTKLELVSLTESYINACDSVDSAKYYELCDGKFTAVYPNLTGCITHGSNLQQFYFEAHKVTLSKSLVYNPHVTLFSNDTAAVVSYTRVYQESKEGIITLTQFEETLVWEKKEEKWTIIHMHRSEQNRNNPSFLPVL